MLSVLVIPLCMNDVCFNNELNLHSLVLDEIPITIEEEDAQATRRTRRKTSRAATGTVSMPYHVCE